MVDEKGHINKIFDTDAFPKYSCSFPELHNLDVTKYEAHNTYAKIIISNIGSSEYKFGRDFNFGAVYKWCELKSIITSKQVLESPPRIPPNGQIEFELFTNCPPESELNDNNFFGVFDFFIYP